MSNVNQPLSSLTEDQLYQLSTTSPKWMFQHNPFFMMHYHAEWVANFAPTYMCAQNPKWMVQTKPQWVAFNAPEVLAQFDLEMLVQLNPGWVVNHIPEKIAYTHPELLKQYDKQVFLIHRPDGTGKFNRLSNFLKKLPFINMAFIKDRDLDVLVPKELMEQIKAPMVKHETSFVSTVSQLLGRNPTAGILRNKEAKAA